jgi:hypothetical protein
MKKIIRILTVLFGSCIMTLASVSAGAATKHPSPSAQAATAPPPAPRLTIGIAAPHVTVNDPNNAASVAESVRRGLAGSLQGSSVDVIPLQATDPALIEAEAQTRHCNYILYSAVEQKSGGHGFLKKLAPFASALPYLAGAGGHGGGMGEYAAQAMAQSAMQAQAMSAQQAAMQQLAGVQQSTVKSGDTVTFEYRLMQPGNPQPLRSDKFAGKARSDGEDVLGPFLSQTVSAVSSATGAPTAAVAQTNFGAPSPNLPSQNPPSQNLMQPGMQGAGGMDCDQLAGMPNSIMSVESCKKMMGTRQAYNSALAAPGASRPGDESMTCAQISAEMSQMRGIGPSAAHVQEGNAAATDVQTTLARQSREVQKLGVEETAEIQAAAAADTATEVASGGLVRGHAVAATQAAQDKRNQAVGERMLKEQLPKEQRMTTATGNVAQDMSQSLTSNPRYARLVQLAGERNCH